MLQHMTAIQQQSPVIQTSFLPIQPRKPNLHSIIKTIYCQNSGVVLGTLEVLILEGHMAYLEAQDDAVYLHPFYRMGSTTLLHKLEACLKFCQGQGWVCSHAEQQRLQLLVSALLHALECIKQDGASLPCWTVSAASAGRLIGLAKWFWYVSSQRLRFPIYSVSVNNENRGWENLRHWIDSAYVIRDSWSSNKKALQKEAELRAREQSIKEIKSESFRRVDTKKVWNWLHLQMVDSLSQGRLETFKGLFLEGDLNAHDWTQDDVEDLQEALLMHCDIGNEIMYFVNKRLEGIKGLIKDFYSSFTIVGRRNSEETVNDSHEQTPEEVAFFAEYDRKIEILTELPNEPKREDFATFGLFLKASATHRILSKRFKAVRSSKSAGGGIEVAGVAQPSQPPAEQKTSGPESMFGELR